MCSGGNAPLTGERSGGSVPLIGECSGGGVLLIGEGSGEVKSQDSVHKLQLLKTKDPKQRENGGQPVYKPSIVHCCWAKPAYKATKSLNVYYLSDRFLEGVLPFRQIP